MKKHTPVFFALLLSIASLPAFANAIPKGSTWWWQISSTPSAGHSEQVMDFDPGIYSDRDGQDPLVASYVRQGKEVICYFSAGTYEKWRADANRIPQAGMGNKMADWDERWLDTRNAGVRAIMTARMVRAKKIGCTGVEPDNVDGDLDKGNNTGFGLSQSDNENYLKFLSDTAHGLGLKIALKNCAQLAAKVEPMFDFALVERCAEYSECNSWEAFTNHGKAVLQAEYKPLSSKVCSDARDHGFSPIYVASLSGDIRKCGQ